MDATKTDILNVDGAKLYYEVRGAGPVLLMIAAGAGDAESYRGVADYLAQHHTVVTYDRRGFSRSPLDSPDQTVEIVNHSDDASRLLSIFGTEPVYVFGCSIGAVIGIDLTIRHPAQVKTLVAHEAPLVALLSEAEREQIRREQESLMETLRRDGATTAIKEFAASVGVNRSGQNSNVGLPQKNAETAHRNREAFFRHDAGAVAHYALDIPALKAVQTQIVPAGGAEGHDKFPYHCAVALAELLGKPLVTFPGTHAGFVDYPREFAEKLMGVLDQN